MEFIKRIHHEWNINCPIDAKNEYQGEHEVYTAIYQIDKHTQLHVDDCEFCEYYKQEKIKKRG